MKNIFCHLLMMAVTNIRNNHNEAKSLEKNSIKTTQLI
jgi:hypothetical protein